MGLRPATIRLLAGLLLLGAALPGLSQTPRVRIGVFGLLRPVELVVRPYQGSVLEVRAEGETYTLEGAQEVRLLLREDVIECHIRQQVVVAERVRVSSRSGPVAEFLLIATGKLERNFRGDLVVTAANGALLPVISMDRETAVASAVAAESPAGARLEALKAQAVATRSYYAARRRRHTGFDYCDTTHCQLVREPPVAGSPAAVAALATRGLVLTYRGQIVPALYSASCGGRTHTLRELGMGPGHYPYFAVNCDYCRTSAPQWESRLRDDRALALLSSHRSESRRIAIGRRMGWKAVQSNNYTARREGDAVVVRGRGRGHGVGLCQVGAAALARDGADFTAILAHYFPNTTLRTGDP